MNRRPEVSLVFYYYYRCSRYFIVLLLSLSTVATPGFWAFSRRGKIILTKCLLRWADTQTRVIRTPHELLRLEDKSPKVLS